VTKRVLIALVVLGMTAFALEGGEYGTVDLLRLKGQVRRERDSIVRLRVEVDSLAQVQRALATDPRTQERAARELYGMIRPGEILYQVVPPDSDSLARRRH
jgi:cell division protein FtsB